MSPKERLSYAAMVSVLLFGVGYVGAQHLKNTPNIVIEQPPARVAEAASEFKTGDTLPSKELVVDVAGSVARPGIQRLRVGSRVNDAIAAAGGASRDADLEALNLAAKLEDGSQVYVPKKGPPSSEASAAVRTEYRSTKDAGSYASAPKPRSARGAKGLPEAGSISLNSATSSQLERLPGVGPATAAKILEYRKEHGGFTSIGELLAVKGIGPKKLEAMRKFVRL